jgi:hypothetical protein
MRRNQTLRDTDITLDDDGNYKITIGSKSDIAAAGSANFIDAGDSKAGLLVIRCFKMREGTSWKAPDLLPLGGGEPWPCKFSTRECGPYATSRGPTTNFQRLRTCLMAALPVAVARPDLSRALALGGVGATLLHAAIRAKLKKKYQRVKSPIGTQVNSDVVKVPGLGGNADHVYWNMVYDCRELDVEIRGFRKGGFRYTNLTCYR